MKQRDYNLSITTSTKDKYRVKYDIFPLQNIEQNMTFLYISLYKVISLEQKLHYNRVTLF